MSTTTDRALAAVTSAVREVLPSVPAAAVTLDASLKALGANSVDRAEILIISMDALGVRCPMVEFAQAADIGGITRILIDAGGAP